MWKQGDLMTSSHINYGVLLTISVSFVLITFYVTATAFARNFEYYLNEGIKTYWNEAEREVERYDSAAAKENLNHIQHSTAECFIVPGDTCSDMEILTESWPQDKNAEPPVAINVIENVDKKVESTTNLTIKHRKRRNGNGNGRGSGNKSNKNGKNLNKKIIAKAQHLKQQKQELAKTGGSTAEPIIYLFALVFIYLLLKAASDINQHYKTQTKDGKRLRRCSLQSYAQATQQKERRMSKVVAQKNLPKI